MKKKTYVVYEIWTRHKLVEAISASEALEIAEPGKGELVVRDGNGPLFLSNWHAVAVEK